MLSNGLDIKGRGHVDLYAWQGVSSSSDHHEKRSIHRPCKEDKGHLKEVDDKKDCRRTSHSLAFTEFKEIHNSQVFQFHQDVLTIKLTSTAQISIVVRSYIVQKRHFFQDNYLLMLLSRYFKCMHLWKASTQFCLERSIY